MLCICVHVNEGVSKFPSGSNSVAMLHIFITSYHLPPSTVVEIKFNPTSYTVNEENEILILFVQKTGENAIPITVDISTSTGSAGGMHRLCT